MDGKVVGILRAIDDENGYKIGDPWRWDDRALGIVVPLTCVVSPKRAYRTNHEVDGVEVKDTGNISVLRVKNTGDKPVFFRTGSVFGGSTQERGLQRSMVVQPGKESDIPVRCVHASKGIRPGGMRDEKVIAPMAVTRNLIGGNQSAVWSSVQVFCSGGGGDESSGEEECSFEHRDGRGAASRVGRLFTLRRNTISSFNVDGFYGNGGSGGSSALFSSSAQPSQFTSSSASDDLLGKLKGADTAKMDEMLRKVPYTEDQVGAFLFDHKGVLGFELFDSPESWKAIKDAIIARFGDEVSDKEADIPFTLDKGTVKRLIKKFIDDLAAAAEDGSLEGGGARTTVVSFGSFVGEYTLLGDDMIHILVSRSG